MSIKNIFGHNTVESPAGMIESLVTKAIDYGRTSIELAKLRTLSKTTDVVSYFFAHTVVFVFALMFLFFLTMGLAIWLGEYLGKSYYGFLLIALLYGMAGLFTHLFLHKRLKRMAADHFIKQVLK